MKRSILTRRNLYPSARALRNEIERITGERLLIRYEKPEVPVVIRFGNSDPIGTKDTDLNPKELIELCSHKGRFSRLIGQAIFTPVYRVDPPSNSLFPILVRTTLTGFGGAGIIPCNDQNDFQRFLRQKAPGTRMVWTQYWPLRKEYRAHVLGGEIVKIFRKIKDDGSPEEGIVIRNSGRGYSFRSVSEAMDNGKFELLKQQIKAMWEILGAKRGFLGVDVGWCHSRKEYLIIEANTAPGLSNNADTCEEYARYLSERI